MSRLVALVSTLIWLCGCTSQPEVSASPAQIEQAVANWLECDECWNRQFDHLVALGPQALPALERYVDSRRRASCREGDRGAKLGELFDRINASGVASLGPDRSAFIQRHLDRHCARLQTRAATAIEAIDGGSLPEGVGLRDGVFLVTDP